MYLITGATGFIGRHLVEMLHARGCAVRCLVRRTSNTQGLDQAELAHGDLRTGEGLDRALDGVDCVLHLAGVTKALRVEDYYLGNGRATANLTRALEGRTARLVHVSSLAAAGPSPDSAPLDEDAEPAPCSHYGKSKLEGERIARSREGAVILRPPVVYGPRDTDVFQILLAVSRGLVLEIAGAERYFSAIYVEDLARAILAAAETPSAAGRTYYVTYREPHTWAELTSAAAAIMGKRPTVVRVPYALAHAVGWGAEIWSTVSRKPGILSRDKVAEARHRYWTCSGARAERELGFSAAVDLKTGLRKAILWYKESGWLKF
jgi:nucleoside-diphosphate-sugar epimerase